MSQYCDLLCFGNLVSLRRLLPSARVDYIRVSGTEWVPNPEERFDAIEMRGPLLSLIPRVVGISLDDLPKTFSVSGPELFRREIPTIPAVVIREAVVNALMHRSYRISQPVQIIRYANRVEIKNAGHSLVPDDRLGEPGSLARNEKIAAILHEVGLAETKGSGIRAMQKLMDTAGLSVPFFESDRMRDTFTATLLTHHLLSKDDLLWLANFRVFGLSDDELKAIVVIREMGALTSADYRRLNGVDTLQANKKLRKLCDYGLLEMKGRGAQLYFKPTQKLLSPQNFSFARPAQPIYEPISEISKADLPLPLQELVDELSDRAPYAEVQRVIRRLWAWRPLRSVDLANILNRSRISLRHNYLRSMVNNGELELIYPKHPNHPKQAYRSSDTYRE
jgi:ATP-dependent DNA helicase RecG